MKVFEFQKQQQEFESSIIDWIFINIHHFSIDSKNGNLKALQTVKPIGDLAQLAECLARTKRHAKIGNDLLDYCWDELENGDLLIKLADISNGTRVLVSLYPPFFKSNRRNLKLEKFINVKLLEHIPDNHKLPLSYTLATLGIDTQQNLSLCLKKDWNKLNPSDGILSLYASYALAHNIFYATKYGIEPENMLDFQRNFINSRLETLLEYFTLTNNLDILAELILVARQIPNHDVPNKFWRKLISYQSERGMVPKLTDSSKRNKSHSRSESLHFQHNYHTTLVALTACVSGIGLNCFEISENLDRASTRSK